MTDEEDVLVAVRGRLAEVPEFVVPGGFVVREMDPDDAEDVDRWLAVHNAAFGRSWTPENFRLGMTENPVVLVDRVYLAERASEAVGTASAGRFRRSPETGVGHYLAVHPSVQGLGLALALCALRYRALAHAGLVWGESQTHAHRIGSLRVHFRCGFVPKNGIDPWNSIVPRDGPLREQADARLREEYAAWRSGR